MKDLKNFIISILKTQQVRIHFLDGSNKSFDTPIKNEQTDDDFIVLSADDKDYFINLASVAYVSKSVNATAKVGTFKL